MSVDKLGELAVVSLVLKVLSEEEVVSAVREVMRPAYVGLKNRRV